MAYELHISNLGRWACDLTRVDVLDANGGQKPLASFSGGELDGMVVHPGGDEAQKSKIGPTGDDWQAGNGPSNTSAHRRALIPIDGRAYISQRFAIDWVELYPDGKTYQGDPADNKNYRAYGHEIHAVADGTVTETKDGLPQNTPGAKALAIPITLETVGGNHVITDMGNGLYAFYAHMQPGTLRVKVGDKVHRGQVLGLLGNTGNSSEPHLHFDICNASSMLAREGFAYAFASFEVVGKGEGWKSSDSHEAAVKHEMEIPTEDEVVQFPPAP